MRFSQFSSGLIFVVLISSIAQSAEEIRLPMTPQGSMAWIEYIRGSVREELSAWRASLVKAGIRNESEIKSAQCISEVLRPGRDEAPQASPGNRIRCEIQTQGQESETSAIFSFGEIPLSAWGNVADRLPYQIQGGIAEALFQDLVRKLKDHLEDPLFSSIEICGPDLTCNESYFINSAPDPSDQPATLACSRGTELTREAIEAIRRGENPLPPTEGKTFYQVMEQEIQAGVRVVTETHCVWLDAR